MSGQPAFNIREFVPQDLEQVHELFANGLIEFAGENGHGVRRYVDSALKEDKKDIPTQYQAHFGGNFWVAEFLDVLIGHVGIQPTDKEGEAELRRMSVSSHWRRRGVGRCLLRTTENFCRSRGYSRIVLSTVDFLKPALAMYRNNDYILVKVESYGVPPVDKINVHHLVKELYPITLRIRRNPDPW